MLLSIIIPAYNVDLFIERCIRSLEDQNIPESQYELIVVNDGSPDKVKEIVLRLQKEFSNIVLIDQVNQGVSVARNNALSKANGMYIMPIDPDDYVLPQTLKSLVDKAVQKNLDVLYLSFDILDANNKIVWQTAYSNIKDNLYSGVEAYFAGRGNQVRDPDRSWAILYKRTILQQFDIKYPKNVPFLEDGLFLGKVFSVSDRCSFDSTPFYQRTTRAGSATHSDLFFSEKAHYGFIDAAVDIKKFRENFQMSDEQFGLVNHVIAKFILLPLTSIIGIKNRKLYQIIKCKIIDAGFNKLDLKGCRAVFYKYGFHYNISIDWFFIYYSYQMLLMSIRYKIINVGVFIKKLRYSI